MGLELLAGILAGLLGLAVGLLFRARRRDPDFNVLRDSVSRTEGALQSVAASLEQRWTTLDEAATRRADETQRTLAGLRERMGELREAHRQLEKLDSHVVDLQNLLTNKQAAGAFGEVQLENLVRQALPSAAFAFQKTLSNRSRVDCLVVLPHPPGPIAIDSKFPVASHREFLAKRDSPEAREARKKFADAVKKHITDIRERYIIPGETSDWAVMFIPSETLFADLHAEFPDVAEHAFRSRVGIVSPATAMALLNTIRGVLRDVNLRTHADVLQAELGVLLQDLDRLATRVGSLQRHFALADKLLRDVDTSARKVLGRAEKIRELDVEPDPVDRTADSATDPDGHNGSAESKARRAASAAPNVPSSR